MQLIIILLVAVSVLTLLSGVSVMAGARKGEKFPAFLFFMATLFALGWALFVGAFLGLPEDISLESARTIVAFYYICAPLMCLMLMSYACYKYRFGKICMGVFGVYALVLIYFILARTELLYSGIELSNVSGNRVLINQNLFNVAYGIYHFATVALYMVGLLIAARRTKSANTRRAHIMVLIGFAITGVLALTFNFLLPAYGKYDTVWIGPLAMSFAWVFHYYAILRYRLLDLRGGWLKTLSYIIIMSLAAIVYLAIFFIIFMSLFRVSSPSTSVIILNIIMITIVILLMPVLTEISGYIRSLVSVKDVDLVYIVKKLTAISKEYINYTELAEFLAEHLHFQYAGLLIGEKLYSSELKNPRLSGTEVEKIQKMKAGKKGVWVQLSDEEKVRLKTLGIEGIAELRDNQGEVVGKILLGRPLGGVNFSGRNLSEIETALTLTAVAIASDRGFKQ
ncbi:hypothetical protein IKE71_03365 [Candidatus Saccharibacteria bacterium]|nr:hypothetical protein [Candidatus Saccharibacteria bacterium]